MKILIFGAGAVGGYFGGRLFEAGADVTFFVRGQKERIIKKSGLLIESPHGNYEFKPKTITVEDKRKEFDIVVLTCKAYDLSKSVDDLKKILIGSKVLLPLLNGISHISFLQKGFGYNNVLGGAAHIASEIKDEIVIRQLNPIQILTFGCISPNLEKIAMQFLEVCNETSFKTVYSRNIIQSLWNKWTFLATLAGSTTLFKSSVGDITSSEIGSKLMADMYHEALLIAEKEKMTVDKKAQDQALEILMKPNSNFTSSMLRDFKLGLRTEHEHILGDLVRLGVKHKVKTPLLSAAYVNFLTKE